MGHQTKINERNGSPEVAPKSLSQDVGELLHDVLTLAELQTHLFIADVRECGKRVLVPGLILLGGVTLGFACFPIALAALALIFIQIFETTHAAGFLMAVGVGTILSSVLCVVGWIQVRGRLAVLQRSRQELVHNLRWIKKVLKRKRITRTNSIDNSWRTMM